MANNGCLRICSRTRSWWCQLLPLTASGKIDRRALANANTAPPLTWQEDAPLQQQLRGLWQQLLGLVEIDVQQNLFDLGARSLTVVRALTELRRRGFSHAQRRANLRASERRPVGLAVVGRTGRGAVGQPMSWHVAIVSARRWRGLRPGVEACNEPGYRRRRHRRHGRAFPRRPIRSMRCGATCWPDARASPASPPSNCRRPSRPTCGRIRATCPRAA